MIPIPELEPDRRRVLEPEPADAAIAAIAPPIARKASASPIAPASAATPAPAAASATESTWQFGEAVNAGVAEAAVARASSSSGQALPGELRRTFEQSLGRDLGDVRLHTGGDSARAADAVGALAYATGRDIHFAAGQYDPSSAAGRHLLAHEVAHTQQQRGASSGPQYRLEVSQPGDHAEVEADLAADAMVSGAPALVASSSGLARRLDRTVRHDVHWNGGVQIDFRPQVRAYAGAGGYHVGQIEGSSGRIEVPDGSGIVEFRVPGTIHGNWRGDGNARFEVVVQVPYEVRGPAVHWGAPRVTVPVPPGGAYNVNAIPGTHDKEVFVNLTVSRGGQPDQVTERVTVDLQIVGASGGGTPSPPTPTR